MRCKIGRNEPGTCGYGKKFKNRCNSGAPPLVQSSDQGFTPRGQ